MNKVIYDLETKESVVMPLNEDEIAASVESSAAEDAQQLSKKASEPLSLESIERLLLKAGVSQEDIDKEKGL